MVSNTRQYRPYGFWRFLGFINIYVFSESYFIILILWISICSIYPFLRFISISCSIFLINYDRFLRQLLFSFVKSNIPLPLFLKMIDCLVYLKMIFYINFRYSFGTFFWFLVLHIYEIFSFPHWPFTPFDLLKSLRVFINHIKHIYLLCGPGGVFAWINLLFKGKHYISYFSISYDIIVSFPSFSWFLCLNVNTLFV